METSSNTRAWFYLDKKRQQRPIMISMLLNAVHFFLDCSFIIHTADRYRLVVLHLNNVLLDKEYTTLRGAKIAFHKIYRHQACRDGIKARWDEYAPESGWMEKKMVLLSRACRTIKQERGEMIKEELMLTEVSHGKL